MKKLLHNELSEAAKGVAKGTVSEEVLYRKLIDLLLAHSENIGLSKKGLRCWLYECSDEDYREAQKEFRVPAIREGMWKAEGWILSTARRSKAFRHRHTDKIKGKDGVKLPLLKSILWKHHFRHIDPDPEVKKEPVEPVFYKPPEYPDRPTVIHRPWV